MKSEITDDELRTIRGDEPVAFYARVCGELLAARAIVEAMTAGNEARARELIREYWKARGNDT